MATSETHRQFIQQVFGGAWIAQAMAVAADLGIADILAEGPRTAEELADRAGANGPALYRVLRALAGVGVFAEDSGGRFSLTPLAGLLQSDVPGSQRAMAIMMGTEFHAAWGELLHTTRTGEQGFGKRFGRPFFEYMTSHLERHAIYDAAMSSVHGSETAAMLDAYDFGGLATIVDIGGGNGQTLVGILRQHPGMRGMVFDLPGVADRARSLIAQAKMSDRCRAEGGDFFARVPAGADAYLLRHVIHDWEDCEATTILRRCREAMGPGGRILIAESIVPPGNEPGFVKWLDLMMLLVGGRERTQEEYSRLFTRADLRLDRVVPTAAEVSILECVAA
jgi:hypothetical protein